MSPLADADLNDGLDQYMGSSDLSDNEEVWSQEMSHYVLETAKRQRQVELFFEESCVVSVFLIYTFCLIKALHRAGTMKLHMPCLISTLPDWPEYL